MRRFSKLAVGLGAAALLIAVAGAYALASSGGGTTITVCVSRRGGTLYRAKKCARPDHKLSWNKQGPAGATGEAGPRGIQGPQGIQGQQGIQGAAGISNYQVVTGTAVESSGSGINLDSAYAYCPPGTSALSGGFSTAATSENTIDTIYVRNDEPVAGSQGAWYVQTTSATAGFYKITPYVVCATVSN